MNIFLFQGLLVEPNIQIILKISSCNFGIGYGVENIGFKSYFSLKYPGSFYHVPSVPLNNSSNFCNNLSNSLR